LPLTHRGGNRLASDLGSQFASLALGLLTVALMILALRAVGCLLRSFQGTVNGQIWLCRSFDQAAAPKCLAGSHRLRTFMKFNNEI
ncbi:MAG: hypothetical protein AAFR12_22920, partial [Cyanobacteria bacterium J06626_6]